MGAREWQEAEEHHRAADRAAREAEERAMQRIMDAFRDKLIAGELTGLVQDDPPFGPWRPIPPHGWHTLEVVDLKRGDFRAGSTVLHAVHFVEGDQRPTIVMEERRGRGRPSDARSYYLAEFRRRCEAGETYDVLSREAEYLEKWVKATHGELTGATAKTIGSNISRLPEWRAAKAAAPKGKSVKR